MDPRKQHVAKAAADLAYNPTLRRWLIRVGATIIGAWMAMLVLGIEVLTSTTYIEGGRVGQFGGYIEERYICEYWTGTSTRSQEVSPYVFTACPVWRWGRQVPD